MTGYRSNTLIIGMFVTALLTMQWADTHIHLGNTHDHGNGQHQHTAQAHSHQLSSDHIDAFDSAHSAETLDVVDLTGEYTTFNEKQAKKPALFVTVAQYPTTDLSRQTNVELTTYHVAKYHHIRRSAIKPRAPPSQA